MEFRSKRQWANVKKMNILFLLFILLFFVFSLLIFYSLIFDSNKTYIYLIYIAAVLFSILPIIAIVSMPCSCPNCGKPFWYWNIRNSPYLFKILLKMTINPFAHVIMIGSPTCPHCGVSYGAEVASEPNKNNINI